MSDECKDLEFANYVSHLKVDVEKIKKCIKLANNVSIKTALEKSLALMEVAIANADQKVKKSLE